MSRSPEVSVVMPVYNAERYLDETIETILRQSLGNFELIAVDDASSDGSLEILQRFAARDARVQVISGPKIGIARARNDGLLAARSEFVACMDSDDLMTPERLERQLSAMRQDSRCVALGSAALRIDPDGDPLEVRHCPLEHEDIESELLLGRNPLIQASLMLRRDAVLQVGGYRDQANYAEDFDLYLRLAEHGRLACLPDVLLHHREHPGRISYTTFNRQRAVIEAALAEAYARRGLSGPVPAVPESWHPATSRGFHIRCCNDAWGGGNVATARKHALALFKKNPFSPRALDLMARTHLGGRAYKFIAGVKALLRPLKGLKRI